VLTIVRRGAASGATEEAAAGSMNWEIERKIWFDRADLQVARLTTYDLGGKIASDIRYNLWNMTANPKYPAEMLIERPGNDYELKIEITKVTFNEDVKADRFVLTQPAGSQLVRVGEGADTPAGSSTAR
jgi:outer membrane lipoprotein-sorting protein